MPKVRAGVFVAATALVFAGCAGAPDRAGGESDEPVTLLTLGQANRGGPAPALVHWAEEVDRLSDGAISIEFRDAWRDEATNERALLADLKDGRFDLASVSSRGLDQVGYPGFQALSAPMLIDSYELEAEVFEAGIVDEMLAGLKDIDLHGVAALPGVLHRLAATHFAPTSASALTGKVVGIADSRVGEDTVRRLGGKPAGVYSSADVSDFDAVAVQPGAISGNGWQDRFRHVAGNVVLWPRLLVIVTGEKVAASLDEDQREVLRLAAEHVRSVAVQDARDDDTESARVLCSSGVSVDYASESDLSALHAAAQPVSDQIARHPRSKRWLEEIEALKLDLATGTDVLTCPGAPPSTAGGQKDAPDGTYQRSFSRAELQRHPLYQAWWPAGRHTLTFQDGVMTKAGPEGDVESFSYTLFQGRIKARSPGPVDFVASYRVDGNKLYLTDFVWPDCGDCGPDEAAFSTSDSKPWVLVP